MEPCYVERPIYNKKGKVIGSTRTYFYLSHTEIELPSLCRNTRLLLPMRNFMGICDKCGKFDMLTQMIGVQYGKVIGHHVAHPSKKCFYDEEQEKVILRFREDLNGIRISNLPPDFQEMADRAVQRVADKWARRFNVSEVA